jgi:hypothetical protein
VTVASNGDQGGRLVTAETAVRVPIVAGWLVDGRSRLQIYAAARDAWDLAPRSVDRLIQSARAEIVAAWDQQRPELTACLLSRYDAIYAAAMACGNHGAALGAVHGAVRLAKLI